MLPMVLRAEIPRTQSIPDMSKTDESLYHGGELVDEVVALASLALGTRPVAGGVSRQFGMDNDPYGRPCEWAREPEPILRFRREHTNASWCRREPFLGGIATIGVDPANCPEKVRFLGASM